MLRKIYLRFKFFLANILFGPSMASLRTDMEHEYLELVDRIEKCKTLEDTKVVYIYINRFHNWFLEVPETHGYHAQLMITFRLRQDAIILNDKIASLS